MQIKSIYDVMAYSNDTSRKYTVESVVNTSNLMVGDEISYVGCYSYDGDIDVIEVYNYTTEKNVILRYRALSSKVYV
jgi:hypothetical protein